VLALASPYLIQKQIVEGDPFLTLVVDNSSSYDLFERRTGLINQLSKRIETEVVYVGSENTSNIGDTLIDAAKNSENMLLMSDGHNTDGARLSDVALFFASQNITLYTLRDDPIHKDVSITVGGPSETVPGVENIFSIKLDKIGDQRVHLLIYIDGKLKKETYTTNAVETFSHVFTQGTHEIYAKAGIADENYFSVNDEYHKTVTVIKKPKVLFVSRPSSPMKRILERIYDVDEQRIIPNSLDNYYMTVLNNVPASEISSANVDMLDDYVSEGNGLVVIGGDKSYDYGGYGSSAIETLLPTRAGEGKEIDDSNQKVNIVFVIDISHGSYGNEEGVAVEKAHAVNILNSLRTTDRVGVIAFNSEVYVVSDMVDYEAKKALIGSNIQKLPFGGTSRMGPAIIYAVGMLEDLSGSNNIVILSDGHTTNRPKTKGVEDNVYEASQLAASKGVTIYTLGVPQDRITEPVKSTLLKKVAELTGGSYDLASRANNVILEFGEEKNREDEEIVNKKTLTIKDSGHFITSGLAVDTIEVGGFNTIVPKSNAQTLVTTNQGYPIVTTWRYGLGRVMSLTTDDGERWGGQLMSGDNSKLLTRLFAYGVGNPKRKEKYYVEIADTRVNDLSSVIVKSETLPASEGLSFSMSEPGLYMATFIPSDLGINSLLDTKFAVNYPKEYENVGPNDDLPSMAFQTGGRFFDYTDVDGIVNEAISRSKKQVSQKVYYRWVLILAALIVLMLEFTIRRILSNRRKI